MALELDFAKQYYEGINLLMGKELPIRPRTCIRLLDRLLGGAAVPFQGEPLQGLQVMGPLETRSLDFDQLIILSANEAVLPGFRALPSFIPPELRVGFSLPTPRSQEDIQSYHFYRMIQRASEVWLVLDSRTEGLKSGEESRYIKQLEYLYRDRFGLRITRHSVISGTEIAPVPPIVKTQADVDAIRSRKLSATALKQYIACPARFYYSFVCGLGKEEEVQETLDGGLVGQIFHEMMHELYDGRKTVTVTDLSCMMKDREGLRRRIDAKIMEKLHQFDVSGEDLVTEEIILEYVLQTLRRDSEYLRDRDIDAFVIEGLELKLDTVLYGFPFKGTIDRLDVAGGLLRVVDYKTGRVAKDEDRLDDPTKAAAVTERLFNKTTEKDRPEIALQMYLYDVLVESDGKTKGELPLCNTIYPVSSLFTAPVRDMEVIPEFMDGMEKGLDGLLEGLASVETGFPRTEDREKTCKYCDFKNICGR
jgi:CRISPR/Cas system-associated exonuclease Cas4 (RecB family)